MSLFAKLLSPDPGGQRGWWWRRKAFLSSFQVKNGEHKEIAAAKNGVNINDSFILALLVGLLSRVEKDITTCPLHAMCAGHITER